MYKIPKIEASIFYFDITFKQMESYAHKLVKESKLKQDRSKHRDPFDKTAFRKELLSRKLMYFSDKLYGRLSRLIRSFPRYLTPFHTDLLSTYPSYSAEEFNQLITHIEFIATKVLTLRKECDKKMKSCMSQGGINNLARIFFGRAKSLFERSEATFDRLDAYRKVFIQFPKILNHFTIALVGLPNVGKSTLLHTLTQSDVDIQSYPFTTKTVMLGYREIDGHTIQFIDTPGLLSREEKNNIEQRSILTLQHLAHTIVCIIDPTLFCGYSLDEQLELYQQCITTFDLPVVIYFSKSDLYTPEYEKSVRQLQETTFSELQTFIDINELLQFITVRMQEHIRHTN